MDLILVHTRHLRCMKQLLHLSEFRYMPFDERESFFQRSAFSWVDRVLDFNHSFDICLVRGLVETFLYKFLLNSTSHCMFSRIRKPTVDGTSGIECPVPILYCPLSCYSMY